MNLMVEMNLNASCKVSSRNNKVNHNSFQNVVEKLTVKWEVAEVTFSEAIPVSFFFDQHLL